MRDFHLALIPGDGIGKEVVPAGQRILDVAAEVHGGYRFTYQTFPWGCQYYLKEGQMMPDNGIETLKSYDAIFLGAVGDPSLVPDHVSLWGLMLPIRRGLQHYVNLRPVKLLRGVRTPLADRGTKDIDFLVVRENNEGEYSNMGGRIYQGTPQEVAIQNSVFTRFGVERVIRYAFELARETGRKRVTSATKSTCGWSHVAALAVAITSSPSEGITAPVRPTVLYVEPPGTVDAYQPPAGKIQPGCSQDFSEDTFRVGARTVVVKLLYDRCTNNGRSAKTHHQRD